MLKLKKVQILGFKSFCDRTELKFPGEGIAAVVGPNGCGKSNISDAISWVLGEQSAKSLRGVHMADVIFAGTRDRKPTGMAEVSLTLVDPQVYEGPVTGEPEIDVQNELEEDDWDEAGIRTAAADATEAHLAEVQPGPLDGTEQLEEQAQDGVAADASSPDAPSEIAADAEPGPQAEASTSEPSITPENAEATGVTEPDAQAAVVAPNAVVLKIRRRKFKPMQFAKGDQNCQRAPGEQPYFDGTQQLGRIV